MQFLRQSTPVTVLIGPFVNKLDGYTAETAETPVVKIGKNRSGLVAKNEPTTPTHDADGYYLCELDSTDTNTVGRTILSVAASADALPVRHEYVILEESIYDAIFAGGASGFDDDAKVSVGGVNTSAANDVFSHLIDGVRADRILRALLAVASGKTNVIDATKSIEFLRRDGSTKDVTIVHGSVPGERTASTLE